MGMAASQARFLTLTARKSNTEWEGQQVNQQRTALANESANLFNQLQAIKVPTPPSTSEYYTTVYTFSTNELDQSAKSGSTEYTVENIYTTPQGTYARMSYMKYNWQPTASTYYSGTITKSVEDENETYNISLKNGGQYVAQKLEYQPTSTDLIFELPEDGKIKFGNSDIEFSLDKTGRAITGTKDGQTYTYEVTELSDGKYSITLATQRPNKDNEKFHISLGDITANLTLNADGTYTVDSISGVDNADISGGYFNGNNVQSASASYLEQSFITVKSDEVDPATGKNKVLQNQPILSYNINGEVYFISATETEGAAYFAASTQIKEVGEKTYIDMPCDYTTASSGRYETLTVTDDFGYSHKFSLNVSSVEDEEAYKQAMLDYEYDKQKYNKLVADINAKTEIIQQEDRTLELRLKQLDTEQNALKTEMDAVKEVIKNNVESTFKTFA